MGLPNFSLQHCFWRSGFAVANEMSARAPPEVTVSPPKFANLLHKVWVAPSFSMGGLSEAFTDGCSDMLRPTHQPLGFFAERGVW